MCAMIRTMEELCRNIQGCVFGYTQSDEITLILLDYQTLETELDSGVCSVYLIYTTVSSGQTTEILSADQIQFNFYA